MSQNNESREQASGEAPVSPSPPAPSAPPPSAPPPSAPPPSGPPLRTILAVVVASVVMLAAGVWLSSTFKSAWSRVAGSSSGEADAGHGHSGKIQYYTCGMHPWVVLPKPGDCPICHMKLVPLDPAKFSNEVAISPVMTQNIGVRTVTVASGPVNAVIRTVGTVDYDETKVRDVNLKISGWVEKLHVDYVGKPVAAGQPLLDIYSPDLYTAQAEYLQAWKNRDASKAAGTGQSAAEAAKWDSDLLEAAAKRLEYFDISYEQMRELERTGTAAKTMTIRSPFQGTVVSKNVYEGMKVDAGTQLYRIADLATVWVMAALYEHQVPYLELGQQAAVSLPYIPGQTFAGTVAYIYPYLNQELRQVKVRIELDNPELLLKPGMFANVEIRRTLASSRTLVPREAVIDTGERQVAFVSLGEGRFEPRVVKVGVEAENGMVEILDGLKQGESAVVSGGFLLDSESRLREALAKMVKGNLAGEPRAPAATVAVALPDAAATAIIGIVNGYSRIGTKLADDTIDGIPPIAKQVAVDVDALLKVDVPGAPHFWREHTEAPDIRGKALELADTTEIEQAREKFADLSTAAAKLLKATGVPAAYGKEVQELHCPMYRAGQGGTWWLQQAGPVRNPFYGKKMLGCFDKRDAIPVSGSKVPAPEK